MLRANQSEFKKAYRNGFTSYNELAQKTETDKSRKMLLFYSVECGLKYIFMKNKGCRSFEDCERLLSKKEFATLTSHDIRSLLKFLGVEPAYPLPNNILTVHDQAAECKCYHEICRYNIGVAEVAKFNEFELVLKRIAIWIRDEI